MGNGVEFITMEPESVQRLEKFIVSLMSPNPVSGPQEGSASAVDETAGFSIEVQVQALLEILQQKSILNGSELREQIRKHVEPAHRS